MNFKTLLSKFTLIDRENGSISKDLLSGLTVALALVPEAVAFAFIAGISPIIGLYGAFMMGFITSIFGGRPGMISGATGAMAVVMVDLVKEGEVFGGSGSGIQFLFATLILAGIIQILAGILRLGKFVRMIPQPVMMGFVNGLAIVIFISQIGMFKVHGNFIQGESLFIMIALVLLTMAIMFFLPKITKVFPAALAGILVVSLIVIFGGIQTETVASFIKNGGGDGIQAGLPVFDVPMIDLNWASFKLMLPYALILAAIGLIESLMTLTLVDELTETRGSANRECVAQGGANMINGFFGGMGGCAMIGQSIINVNSGGRGRLSGLVASLALLSFILFGAQVIEKIPIAALVGVMFMVVIGTFAWSSFRIIRKIPVADAVVLISVSSLTVIFDLAIAVISGVIISALVFSWENAIRIRARKSMKEDGTKVYNIWGVLFFGSVQVFMQKFDPKNDPEQVEIDFIESKVQDHSGVEALIKIIEKYNEAGKKVQLTHLSPDCIRLLRKVNPDFEKYIKTDVDDPRYYVVTEAFD
ncbi:MAG: SulP family inorganic anion transporter [Crocinitomicaceae bacterium]